MAQEFLPLCDVLFNIISLAAYFCDVVFDSLTVYTLYETNQIAWFITASLFIMTSLISSQIVSYQRRTRTKSPKSKILILTLHFLQCGVLWRYFKLFIPVDLRHVKLDVRDLCILRMIHAFCQSIPMLMIQLYLTWSREPTRITCLNVISTILSLLNVCWALASFNKNIRNKNVHKLVLTWLGVLSQLFWRVGTVSARVVVLTVYATLYHHWTLLVIFLHWLTMFLWLISPKNVFRGEKISFWRKHLLSILIGFIYVFCYINLQESNAWRKLLAFYTTMCLENSLLMAVWLVHRPQHTWFQLPAVAIVWGGFAFGILSMAVYYGCFHLRRVGLPRATGADRAETNPDAEAPPNKPAKANGVGYVPGVFNCRLNPGLKRKKKKPTSFVPPASFVPPTSFVPPPASASLGGKTDCPFWKRGVARSASGDVDVDIDIREKLLEKNRQRLLELKEMEEEMKGGKIKRPKPAPMDCPFWKRGVVRSASGDQEGSGVNIDVDIREKLHEKNRQRLLELKEMEEEMKGGKAKRPKPAPMDRPFWKRGAVRSASSDQEGSSVGSRVNIQQKLHEKKQQQLQELKEIEEEIKQGKIERPKPIEDQMALRLIPRCKKRPVVSRRAKYRAKTAEILLAPQYLENHHGCQDYKCGHVCFDASEVSGSSFSLSGANRKERSYLMYKSYRVPSDLDSQVSLPRSYTLPREFRYCRKGRSRKPVRAEHFAVASTNSSDGDVDSGDGDGDGDFLSVNCHVWPSYRLNNCHETKL